MKKIIGHSVPLRLKSFANLLLNNKKYRAEHTSNLIAYQDENITCSIINCDGEREAKHISRKYIWRNTLITPNTRQNINNSDFYDDKNIIHCGKCNKIKEALYVNEEIRDGEQCIVIKWQPLACDCELRQEADFTKQKNKKNIIGVKNE